MAADIEHEIETLLRGEIAAAETYRQVLEDADDPEAEPLRAMRDDHVAAVRFLRDQLVARGVEAPKSSGAWGTFAKTVEGTAKLAGDRAALAALREGEKRGLRTYEESLESGNLPLACRAHVEQALVPAQRRHIEVLNRLIDGE